MEYKYPRSAKIFLARRGVAIEDYCRVGCDTLRGEELEVLGAFDKALTDFISRI